MVANQYFLVVTRLFIPHTVGNDDVSGDGATLKIAQLVLQFSASNDHRLRPKRPIAAIMKAVRAADRCWQTVLWTIESQRPRFAVVVRKNPKPAAIFRRKCVA